MRTRGITAEDFCNYKLPSMFISSVSCDWKCCRELGCSEELCQNSSTACSPILDIDDKTIYDLFESNEITKSVVIGGLEPFLQFDEVVDLISLFRDNGEDCDFVIYTGYYPEEIDSQLSYLSLYKNIVIKFGRYIPDSAPVYDDILGVKLASNNQFAIRII